MIFEHISAMNVKKKKIPIFIHEDTQITDDNRDLDLFFFLVFIHSIKR